MALFNQLGTVSADLLTHHHLPYVFGKHHDAEEKQFVRLQEKWRWMRRAQNIFVVVATVICCSAQNDLMHCRETRFDGSMKKEVLGDDA